MPKPLQESITLSEATASTEGGLLEVDFITPGWGSSGYYSREVLEAAAPLFTAGTHMYFDHPSTSQETERPERSVRDLAAVVAEAGHVDTATGAIRGKVRPLKAYAELLTDEAFATNVGLSIRGSATDIVEGEAEGRRGRIIEGLADVQSVDFVTRAGRGGRVLAVLESAGVAEATVNDTREALQQVLRDAYGGDKTYVWVRDFDDSTVWFEVNTEGSEDLFGQSYTGSGNDVALTGERTEVRVVTTYVPATRPGSTTTTTEESEEDTMPNIEESELARLREDAGRVQTLEERATTAEQRAEKVEQALAERDRRDAARKVIAERAKAAGVTYREREIAGFLADLPLTESGDLDAEKLAEAVDADAAELKEAAGEGRPHGFGSHLQLGDAGGESVTESVFDNVVASAFGRPVKEA